MVQIIPSREDSLDRLVDENAQQFSDEQENVEDVCIILYLPACGNNDTAKDEIPEKLYCRNNLYQRFRE